MKKILVVDDQEHVRELVEVTLSTADYDASRAWTGGDRRARGVKLWLTVQA